MRLLLTSDLHRDGAKLLWLLEEAPPHDALLISGDLLDLFSKTSFEDQKSGTLRWRQSILDTRRSFAWCSGNHDFFHGKHTPMLMASPLWMRETPSSAVCVTDGETRLLKVGEEQVAITTLPWPVYGGVIFIDGAPTKYLDFVKRLLCEGKKLQAAEGVPWICLFHEPPWGTPLCATCQAPEANFILQLIEEAKPDFSLHGHIHQAPTAPGGSWICRLGKTVYFNAGQSLPGEALQYILLDWRAPDDWTAQWHGDGRILTANAQS